MSQLASKVLQGVRERSFNAALPHVAPTMQYTPTVSQYVLGVFPSLTSLYLPFSGEKKFNQSFTKEQIEPRKNIQGYNTNLYPTNTGSNWSIMDGLKHLAGSFVEAQQHKTKRANEMIHPIASHVTSKVTELASLPEGELASRFKEAMSIQDQYKENKDNLKKTGKAIEIGEAWFLKKLDTLDPSTKNLLAQSLKTTTGTAQHALKILGKANTVYSVVLAVSTVLYPEQKKEFETFVKNKLDEFSQDPLVAARSTAEEFKTSMKDQFKALREQGKEQSTTEGLESEVTSKKSGL